nr:hypothetical protein CFP56_34320 [Quercus suber]
MNTFISKKLIDTFLTHSAIPEFLASFLTLIEDSFYHIISLGSAVMVLVYGHGGGGSAMGRGQQSGGFDKRDKTGGNGRDLNGRGAF